MKRVGAIAVSAFLLFVLYARIDGAGVWRVLIQCDAAWLAVSLGLFVPQVWLSASRWRLVRRAALPISIGESARQVLATCALNLAVPSKLGDLAKGAAGASDWEAAASGAGSAAFEKLLDLGALALLSVCCGVHWWSHNATARLAVTISGLVGLGAALAIAGSESFATWLRRWHTSLAASTTARRQRVVGTIVRMFEGVSAAATDCVRRRSFATTVGVLTLLLWGAHLAQIHCFFLAVGASVDWRTVFALVPSAILAGLVPGPLWGVGPRDSVLVLLFAGLEPSSRVAAVGVLLVLRYVIPGLAGLPYLSNLRPVGLKPARVNTNFAAP